MEEPEVKNDLAAEPSTSKHAIAYKAQYEFMFIDADSQRIAFQKGEEFYVNPDAKKVVEAMKSYMDYMNKHLSRVYEKLNKLENQEE